MTARGSVVPDLNRHPVGDRPPEAALLLLDSRFRGNDGDDGERIRRAGLDPASSEKSTAGGGSSSTGFPLSRE